MKLPLLVMAMATAAGCVIFLLNKLRSLRRELTEMRRQAALYQPALAAAQEHREQQLLLQLQQISTIFDSLNAVVYVADLDTMELLFVNAYGRALFGNEILGRRCYEVLQTGQPVPCAFCTNGRLVKDDVAQPPYAWEFQNTVTNGWFLCIDRAIPWTDGRLVRMEIAVDISQQKRAEQFRDDYISIISHDLRNPLTTVAAMSEFLQSRLAAMGAVNEARAAGLIVQSGQHMNAMIGDLLESAHFEAGTLELQRRSVDLPRLIDEVVTRTCAIAEYDRVDVHIDAGVPILEADGQRLDRVLANLLTNALKYSPRESAVRVRLAFEREEVCLTIANAGPGIAPDHMPKLFTKYFRAGARTPNGLGLGLYTTRLIVEAHGGRIWAESTPGVTTFSIALPLVVHTRLASP